MRWARHLALRGNSRHAYRVLVGKPEERRELGKQTQMGDNIKIDVQEVGWGMDWIDLAQNRDRFQAFVNVIMKLRVL
jgi:hypothetical protein